MRRSSWLALSSTVTVASALLACAGPTASAQPPGPTVAKAAGCAMNNYDGGGFRTAFGIPGGSASYQGRTLIGAGTVEALCLDGTRQSLQLPTAHAGDHFGASVTATAAVNTDHYEDLIVGIPDYDVGSHKDAGAVAIFLGSPTGLKYSKTLTQSSKGVPGSAQTGAHFGAAVSTTASSANEYNVVRVGEPGKDVGDAIDAGGFVDLAYSRTGEALPRFTKQVTLDTHGIPGHPQSGDLLGSSLFRTAVVGAPGRTVDGKRGAGAVLQTTSHDDAGYTGRVITQNSSCVSGTAESNDHFGAAVADRWVGVPGEDLGSAVDAGMVERWAPDDSGTCPSLTQNSPHVSGAPESGDHFGASLFIDFQDYDDGPSSLAMFIGVPGEDTSYGADAGYVDIVNLPGDGDAGNADSVAPTYLSGTTPGAAFGTAFGGYGLDVYVSAPGAGAVYAFNSAISRSSGYGVYTVKLDDILRQETGTKGKGYYATSISSYDGF